jgi:hypothetical protein
VIVRVMGRGQFRLSDEALVKVNEVDAAVQAALAVGDEQGFQQALADLAAMIEREGTPVPPDEFTGSDVIVPDAETTIAEAGHLLSEDGLIPG